MTIATAVDLLIITLEIALIKGIYTAYFSSCFFSFSSTKQQFGMLFMQFFIPLTHNLLLTQIIVHEL